MEEDTTPNIGSLSDEEPMELSEILAGKHVFPTKPPD
ncbi:MAG: hypothetical protein K0S15_910 [Solirubrobacterales bacterium]|nr:hypothetical protein [Solirubrobacterales bacterium]